MQNGWKAVWSIPYISVASFFQSLKQNFIAYRSSKVSDSIFEIHQLWQSGFSRVYSNCCCSCSFEPEIIKIGQSSHRMYSNNRLNFQESTTILNACTKKSLETFWMHHVYYKADISDCIELFLTVLFLAIQFSINTWFSSIWLIDSTTLEHFSHYAITIGLSTLCSWCEKQLKMFFNHFTSCWITGYNIL